MAQYMKDQEAADKGELRSKLADILNNPNLTEEEKFKVCEGCIHVRMDEWLAEWKNEQ